VVPPLVGVAVKVTEVPAQMVVADAPILTLAGKLGFTVMVLALLTVVPFSILIKYPVPAAVFTGMVTVIMASVASSVLEAAPIFIGEVKFPELSLNCAV
jgi:hypothetical protein